MIGRGQLLFAEHLLDRYKAVTQQLRTERVCLSGRIWVREHPRPRKMAEKVLGFRKAASIPFAAMTELKLPLLILGDWDVAALPILLRVGCLAITTGALTQEEIDDNAIINLTDAPGPIRIVTAEGFGDEDGADSIMVLLDWPQLLYWFLRHGRLPCLAGQYTPLPPIRPTTGKCRSLLRNLSLRCNICVRLSRDTTRAMKERLWHVFFVHRMRSASCKAHSPAT